MTTEQKLEILKQAIEMGAKINIYFYNNEHLQAAYDKLKPFTKLGAIKKNSNNGTVWVKIENDKEKIEIASFL